MATDTDDTPDEEPVQPFQRAEVEFARRYLFGPPAGPGRRVPPPARKRPIEFIPFSPPYPRRPRRS